MGSLLMMDDLKSKPIIKELNTALTETVSWETLGSKGIIIDLLSNCLLPVLKDM